MANTERSFKVGRIQAPQAIGSPSCPPLPGRSPSVPSTVLGRDTRMGQSSSGGGAGGDQQSPGDGPAGGRSARPSLLWAALPAPPASPEQAHQGGEPRGPGRRGLGKR